MVYKLLLSLIYTVIQSLICIHLTNSLNKFPYRLRLKFLFQACIWLQSYVHDFLYILNTVKFFFVAFYLFLFLANLIGFFLSHYIHFFFLFISITNYTHEQEVIWAVIWRVSQPYICLRSFWVWRYVAKNEKKKKKNMNNSVQVG